MKGRLKPWQWRLALVSIGSVLLSLFGGYGVTVLVSRLRAQSALLDKMKLVSDQDSQATQSQNLWLQRFAEEQSIIARMEQHPYMNPPNRQILQQQLREMGEGISFERIVFAPEESILRDGGYGLCRQQITVDFTAQDDRAVVEWMERVGEEFYGVMAVKSFSLNLQGDHNKHLKGDVVWEWAFLRLLL